MLFFKTLLAAALLSAALPVSAATLLVNSSGILTGATGVTIGDRIYSVTFKDSTCAAAFGACATANFDFKTLADATAASKALMDQVFIDTGSYKFDTLYYYKVSGCGAIGSCDTIIPYAYDGSDYFSDVFNSNRQTELLDSYGNAGGWPVTVDLATSSSRNIAKFTLTYAPPAPTPEPASWAMFIGGFGLIGGTMRRKRGAPATA
jgi:hypothetical protein